MSAPGHCRHCWAGGDGCHIGSRDHGLAHSNWNDGHCPACDEAERIADRLNDEAEIWGTIAGDAFNDGDPGLDVYGSDTKARTFAEAARIARGLR